MNDIEQIKNPVRKALLQRRVTLGTWIQIGSSVVAEIFSNAGFNWVAADCEHSDIDIEVFSNLVRGMYGRGSVPMARVRENNTLAIRQVLDAGAQGVIVPLVNTAEEARKAVLASKFPPIGVRGFSFFRANNWGVDFDEYAESANRDIAVVVMIESKQAVENIDEILAVEGIDGVLIGPYDMSGSYGITGQTSHPLMIEACNKVVHVCKKHRKSAGIHIVKPTDCSIKKALDDGFTFIALGIDTVFLDQSARGTLNIVRKVMED
ncbi:aldolase/citrate lyase family protein [Petroclostridium sp. X23]|uniref:HpcH/HpaI aldolase family protein n=1 Tax=Petroclostridium sp. X23 TaxID=3045146 RepID=UPI0024ACACE6|nr:aldolase/citrate lyase family protein [Petroclostridium sp. X23]WHH61490.1 aldolase/citrate lyase family protein [Petroclostridium sp. X23]